LTRSKSIFVLKVNKPQSIHMEVKKIGRVSLKFVFKFSGIFVLTHIKKLINWGMDRGPMLSHCGGCSLSSVCKWREHKANRTQERLETWCPTMTVLVYYVCL